MSSKHDNFLINKGKVVLKNDKKILLARNKQDKKYGADREI